jgi:hypothetical protein
MSKKDKTNKKDEMIKYDDIVATWNLPFEICPAGSTLVEKTEGVFGEQLFTHDLMFLVKRIANTRMNIDSDNTMGWAPIDAKNFYIEHHLSKTYIFDETFMNEGKKSISNWYFKGRSSTYMRYLAYRWNNNMAFLNYKERIDIALNMRMADDAMTAREALSTLEKAKSVQDSLQNTINGWKSEPGVPAQLVNLLDGVEISLADLIENGD